jgi:hypothetical protein
MSRLASGLLLSERDAGRSLALAWPRDWRTHAIVRARRTTGYIRAGYAPKRRYVLKSFIPGMSAIDLAGVIEALSGDWKMHRRDVVEYVQTFASEFGSEASVAVRLLARPNAEIRL